MHTHRDTRATITSYSCARSMHTRIYVCTCVPMRGLRHISKRGAECMRGCIWVGERGRGRRGRRGGDEKRVVCGCYGNAQSLSYNYMGKNGSRTFTPRYTPTAFSPDSAFSPFPILAIAVAAPLLLLLPPRLLSTCSTSLFSSATSSSSISCLSSSADCFFYAFYFSSGFTSPSHRTAAPTLLASGILCLHLTGATV